MKPAAAQPGVSRPMIRGRVLASLAAALALVAAGCSSGSSTSVGSTPVKGGVAVWAEPPSSTPTYIFPYMNSANISNLNLFDFQYLMYRPLYWFGVGDKPTVNSTLSVASPPAVSGRTVTITLKHYMWSNGTQVTAQDVMFWLNMELAEPANYGAYTGFPANVSDIKVLSPTKLSMVMSKSYGIRR
jgi:peptide/nickel transport system substrate-binding protein